MERDARGRGMADNAQIGREIEPLAEVDDEALRAKVARVYALLVETYGIPPWEPDGDALGGLIATVLSQHTSDVNSARAYARLVETFPTWEQVRDAPVAAVAEAIRQGGLAQTKAERIQQILARADHPTRRRTTHARCRRAHAARRRADVFANAAGRRTEDGGVCAALLARPARLPGRHARLARHATPRPDQRQDPGRRGSRGPAAADPAGVAAHDARQSHPPR